MKLPAEIFVRFNLPGIHCWKDATDNRAYLKYPHRHLFHFTIKMEVGHNNREVEFHDLILKSQMFVNSMCDDTSSFTDQFDFGGRSCEHIASELGQELANFYKRFVTVTVSEDEEAGASVCCIPDEL